MNARVPVGALLRLHGRLDYPVGVAANAADALAAEAGAATVRVFEPSAPVLSLGRRSRDNASDQQAAAIAAARGWLVSADDRGGRATLHLPGQLVALVAWPCSREAVAAIAQRLVAAAAAVAHNHGASDAEIRHGADLGVWRGDGKLASLGLRHQRGVLRHGLSLNVAVDRNAATGLVLCGREAAALASLDGADGIAASSLTAAVGLAVLAALAAAEDGAPAWAAATLAGAVRSNCLP